jgi:D-alanine-D-alanine ligase
MIDDSGAALVEEFIEGDEATVLVVENADDPTNPHAYRPIQYRFPEGETFKHYDLKWVDFHGLSAFPVEDPELDEKLRTMSCDFFRGIGGASYGRCDIRIDREGRPFMLEINPNCGVFYPPTDPGSADLILMNDPQGHAGFAKRIVEAAFARHERRRRSWQVLPRATRDYGIFATRDIAKGETIMVWEEQAHHLVTRSRVERAWDERHREWFVRYAWPLTDEIFVMWSDDPREWRPVNHACDPNAWLEGLDVVARRPIARGEEILLDYATFYDERMPPFACGCGAEECRRVIRGEDYLLDLVARYEGHLSDHVARRRAARLAATEDEREPAAAAGPQDFGLMDQLD